MNKIKKITYSVFTAIALNLLLVSTTSAAVTMWFGTWVNGRCVDSSEWECFHIDKDGAYIELDNPFIFD